MPSTNPHPRRFTSQVSHCRLSLDDGIPTIRPPPLFGRLTSQVLPRLLRASVAAPKMHHAGIPDIRHIYIYSFPSQVPQHRQIQAAAVTGFPACHLCFVPETPPKLTSLALTTSIICDGLPGSRPLAETPTHKSALRACVAAVTGFLAYGWTDVLWDPKIGPGQYQLHHMTILKKAIDVPREDLVNTVVSRSIGVVELSVRAREGKTTRRRVVLHLHLHLHLRTGNGPVCMKGVAGKNVYIFTSTEGDRTAQRREGYRTPQRKDNRPVRLVQPVPLRLCSRTYPLRPTLFIPTPPSVPSCTHYRHRQFTAAQPYEIGYTSPYGLTFYKTQSPYPRLCLFSRVLPVSLLKTPVGRTHDNPEELVECGRLRLGYEANLAWEMPAALKILESAAARWQQGSCSQ
ncbi:hypothetical protein BC629DRAFT_1442058 [Irpex lacteus]|nr:hypothetical protein BC629DRAFT_1442058 [Irpex lacteus]